MEAKQFSYSRKLELLIAIGDHVAGIRELMVQLSAHEAYAADPNHGDFYEMNTTLDEFEDAVDQLAEEVEPMASMER
jgi:hypothetical protein